VLTSVWMITFPLTFGVITQLDDNIDVIIRRQALERSSRSPETLIL
jgi:hypothetical protein